MTSTEKLRGLNVTVTVEQERAGGLFYNPLPGHLLRTPHDTPQVNSSSWMDTESTRLCGYKLNLFPQIISQNMNQKMIIVVECLVLVWLLFKTCSIVIDWKIDFKIEFNYVVRV